MSERPKPKHSKSRICTAFAQKGKCAFGAMCRSSHDVGANGSARGSQQSPKPSSSAKSVKSSSKPQKKRPPPMPVVKPADSIPSRSPTPDDPLEKQEMIDEDDEKEPCVFWPGNCGSGDQCAFLHVDPAPAPAEAKTVAESSTSKQKENLVCKHFLKGSCKRGTTCSFAHPKGTSSSTESRSSKGKGKEPAPTYRPASPFGYGHVENDTSDDETEQGNDSDTDTESRYADSSAGGWVKARTSARKTHARDPPIVEDKESVFEFSNNPKHRGPTQVAQPPAVAPPPPQIQTPTIAVPHITQAMFHWSQFADPNADPNVAFCKQLTQNNCALQAQCRFRHSLTPEEYTTLFKDQQPMLMTLNQSLGTAQGAVPQAQPVYYQVAQPPPIAPTIPVIQSPPPPAKPPISKVLCAFWIRNKCQNGDKCPFRHEGTPITETASGYDSMDNLRGTSPVQDICRHFQKGHCIFGDKCQNSHIMHSDIQNYRTKARADANGWGAPAEEDNGWGVSSGNPDAWGESDDHTGSKADDGWWGSDDRSNNRTERRDNWSSNSNTRTSDRSSGRICYDYQVGRCTRGDRCRFSHDLGSGRGGPNDEYRGTQSRSSGSSSSRCKFYDQGDCRRGNACSRRHEDGGSWKRADSYQAEGWGSAQDEGQDHQANGWGAEEGTTGDVWGQDAADDHRDEDEGEPRDGDVTHEDERESAKGSEDEGDGSDGWNTSRKWFEPSDNTDRSTSAKKRPLCLKFGQGACRRDDCAFQHSLPSDQAAIHSRAESAVEDDEIEETQEAEPEVDVTPVEDVPPARSPSPEIEEHPLVQRFVNNCTVRFDAQCQPEEIMTAADSKKLVLSHLPIGTTDEEIQRLVKHIGAVKEVVELGTGEATATFSVEFEDAAAALIAVRLLNGKDYSGQTVVAKLDSRATVSGRSPLDSQVLLVSWPCPTLTAWIFYETVTIAKQAAQKINGVKFQDRTIKALYEAGKGNKRGPWPVRVTNLPPAASKDDLKGLCDVPFVVTDLGQPTYTESPRDAIQEALEEYGGVLSFEDSLEENTVSKNFVYATMEGHAAAQAAAKALNKTKPSYIGEQYLTVQHIYLAGFQVPAKAFECVADQVKVIREVQKGTCTVVDWPLVDTHVVKIYAPVDQAVAFCTAHAELEKVADGLVVTSEDGANVWDDYLETTSAEKAIEKFNERPTDVPCFVYIDKRYQVVRVYGAPDGQKRGQAALMKILKTVNEQRHELAVPPGEDGGDHRQWLV
ncbi:RING finger protein [Coprinopsis cinerea AmutBmut pab1-1]|nr:RING finger protein [Coprinopsis cinerea AmutBmut pab1-1]